MHDIMGIVLNPVRALSPAILLAFAAAITVNAQTATTPATAPIAVAAPAVQAGVKLSPQMARRIEVMIRNRSGVSADMAVTVSTPTASDIPGYAQVIVTFSEPGTKDRSLPFLVSADGNTLAQFNKFNISGDTRTAISDAGRPARGGDEHAPVHIVVFDDLECPFCARMNDDLMPAVRSRYKDQVRIVYRDFPLDELHPWAIHAAVDANCLATETPAGYWNYVDYVHAHSAELGANPKSLADSEKQLDKLALDEGTRQKVNQPELVACVLKQDTAKIQASIDTATSEPIHIDPPQAPVTFINGERIEGIVPIETLYRVIDRALIAEGATPPPPAAAAQPSPAATTPAKTPAPGQPAQTKPGT